MKFPQIPLHDLEGATLNFEALQLRSILDRDIASGTVTLTWPGGTGFAGNQTITHGLGKLPTQVLLGSQFMSASPFVFTPFVNSALSAATFVLSGLTPGATPAAATTGVAWWLAIG